MDDLSGLEWSPSSSIPTQKLPPKGTGNYYATIRSTPPLSGRSTPLIQNGSTSQGTASDAPIKSSAAATTDSFANLVSFSVLQSTKILSLQDQQKKLQEEKQKQDSGQRKHLDVQADAQTEFWDKLSNGRATPDRVVSPPTYAGTDEYGGQKLSSAINRPFEAINGTLRFPSTKSALQDENDLLSGLNSDTPVDRSSCFQVLSKANINGETSKAIGEPSTYKKIATDVDEDDPFDLAGLSGAKSLANTSAVALVDDEDDVLGLLGHPISELPPRPSREQLNSSRVAKDSETLQKAVAELMDMGFPRDISENALAATDSGLDIQVAVGLILNQAHEDSHRKKQTSKPRVEEPIAAGRSNNNESHVVVPAWMQQQNRANSSRRREDSRSPANNEKDPAKYAAELGTNIFKSANTLWKTGTKKLNQAVAEFNSDSDSSQPKWMKDTTMENSYARSRKAHSSEKVNAHDGGSIRPRPRRISSAAKEAITDEALMLESADGGLNPRRSIRRPEDTRNKALSNSSNDRSPTLAPRLSKSELSQPKLLQHQQQQQTGSREPQTRLNRQLVEEQSSQAYISPARRKKAILNPTPPKPPLLLDGTEQVQFWTPRSQISAKPTSQSQSRSTVSVTHQHRAPQRIVPPLADSSLHDSRLMRHAGTSAFKLGNYSQASSCYTNALSSLPAKHPLTIPLLTNRALTHLKVGEPKASIQDADEAIIIIGPSKGQNELIDLGSEEGSKPMFDFWAKAMTRKAEALEQLEKWTDASMAWKECVEAGVGGNTSIQGRDRCINAFEKRSTRPAPIPRRPPTVTNTVPPKPAPKLSALDELSGRSALDTAPSTEAVTRLRAANAEAEKVDDEKFALADSVEDRLNQWRKGKEGNLRALLGSLDTVLWEGAGFKKVGMSELVLPGKVKVIYMKGIGRVHPDKVCLEI